MKAILPQLILPLCTAALAALGKTNPAQQESLVGENMMAQIDNKVPGYNDVVYDIVPKEDQIYEIEWLEISPTPFSTDHILFILLSGWIPDSKKKELGLPNGGLINATLTITLAVIYPDGTDGGENLYTIPLKTMDFNSLAHLVIRDERGFRVDYMPSSGDGTGILVDFRFMPMFMRSGMWTFKVDARVGDANNTCLFAMSTTQWLEGRL